MKEKMKTKAKVTVVDVIIIVLVGLSLFSFSTKYEPRYEYGFSGSQIYKAVQECEELDSTGFLYTVYVRGYWNADVGHFEEEAFVVDTGRGYLQVKLKNGRTVTIGGKMAYKEDVQAVDIEIHIKSKSSVVYLLEPIKGSKDEVKEYVNASAGFINYEKEDIAVTAVLTMEAEPDPSILLEAEIENTLQKEVFFMKKVDVEVYEDGVTVSVERLSMKEYETFFEVLERYFSIHELYTGDITVVYQTAEEIDVEDVVHLESYQGGQVYPGSIHVRV